jgi:hypothetical protein
LHSFLIDWGDTVNKFVKKMGKIMGKIMGYTATILGFAYVIKHIKHHKGDLRGRHKIRVEDEKPTGTNVPREAKVGEERTGSRYGSNPVRYKILRPTLKDRRMIFIAGAEAPLELRRIDSWQASNLASVLSFGLMHKLYHSFRV